MITISELSELYKDREGDISVLEKEDKKKIKKLLKEREEKNKQLEIAISNIPDGFKCIIENLNKAIQEKLETENRLNGYFNEKSYIAGFCNAINYNIKLVRNNGTNINLK